jgi:hypothetical protein
MADDMYQRPKDSRSILTYSLKNDFFFATPSFGHRDEDIEKLSYREEDVTKLGAVMLSGVDYKPVVRFDFEEPFSTCLSFAVSVIVSSSRRLICCNQQNPHFSTS